VAVKVFNTNRIEILPVPLSKENLDILLKLPDDLCVSVDFGNGSVKCTIDSGTEISVLKGNMLPKSYVHGEHNPTLVKLSEPFGEKVSAQFTLLSGHIVNPKSLNKRNTSVLLNCAVTDHLLNDVALISFKNYQTLRCG
jgi:hypothetical protein